MKHDNDNVARSASSDSSIGRQLSEFWQLLVEDAIWTLQESRRPQPLLQPVRVVARVRDRNPPDRRY